MLKKMRPMPDSKSQLFLAPFSYFGAFLAPNHDFHRSLINILAIRDPSYRQLQLFLLLRMPGSSKMAENWSHFLRSVAIRAVHPVHIIHRWFEDNAKPF